MCKRSLISEDKKTASVTLRGFFIRLIYKLSLLS